MFEKTSRLIQYLLCFKLIKEAKTASSLNQNFERQMYVFNFVLIISTLISNIYYWYLLNLNLR